MFHRLTANDVIISPLILAAQYVFFIPEIPHCIAQKRTVSRESNTIKISPYMIRLLETRGDEAVSKGKVGNLFTVEECYNSLFDAICR